MTRRTFLTQTGSLAAGLAATATPARPQGRTTKKVIVCGAGISGLSCGYELLKRGHEVVVLEALGRSGGHVLTVRDHLADGLYADAGAEHFYRRGYDEFFGYLDEFDLPLIRYPRRDAMVLPLRLGHLAEPVLGGLMDHALGEVRRRASPSLAGAGRLEP